MVGRWLDPACGDGAFLLEFVRRLADAVPAAELPRTVEERVFGFDLDITAVDAARVAVREEVERRCGALSSAFLAGNIRVADFLELDPEPDYDVIAGNPPYVSATQLTAAEKERFLERFATAWGRLDLYTLFIEHGLRFLRAGGRLAYITPDKWLGAASNRRLRTHLARNYVPRTIDRFERHDLFPGVATVPCVTMIERPRSPVPTPASPMVRWWSVDPGGGPQPVSDAREVSIRSDGTPWLVARPVPPVEADHAPLGDLVERISVGVATGLNSCFVLDAEGVRSIEPELLRPVARGRDIAVGQIRDAKRWMLVPYCFSDDGTAAELIDLDEFPGAAAHLARHQEALKRRHCVRVWGKAWYDLHDPITFDLARRTKVLLPDLAQHPRFAVDNGRALPLHSAYYVLPRPGGPLDAGALADALNDPVVAEELRTRAPTAKSGYRRFRAQILRDILVPLASRSDRDAA